MIVFQGYFRRSAPAAPPVPAPAAPDFTSAAAVAFHSSNAVGR